MTSLRTRLATAPDFDGIARITNHYIRTTAIHFGTTALTTAELRQTWSEHVDLYPWLVAEIGGSTIGYAKAGPYRARAAYRWTTETGIYLDPDHCGCGHGQPLYQLLLSTLRAQGFHAAIGGIALPNAASVRLHERLGFVHCGTVPRAGRKFNRWHDVGFWHLALQPLEQEPAPILPPHAVFADCT